MFQLLDFIVIVIFILGVIAVIGWALCIKAITRLEKELVKKDELIVSLRDSLHKIVRSMRSSK